jgi:UDP-N-acetyl-D-glucosamine/UDP-N-acetyl-D-galactosamine dehydrogenase
MSASHGRRVALVGLGYVGLPVAVALGRIDRVVAYDIDAARLNSLRTGHDHTGEVSDAELAASSLQLTSDAKDLQQADFFIIAVPTPVDLDRRPDLSAFLSAAETVAGQLKPGDIVVFESTVYPGATEEDAVPVLERRSGLKLGSDFAVGYSPKRINPGDRQHSLESVVKVISASDAQALDVIAGVYGSIVQAGVYRAPSIRVAEAAKVIENTQRDLNIALINELALIFHRLGIDTGDVLAAAGTKWNFLPFRPGLVGGHCIGVDPYYLTHSDRDITRSWCSPGDTSTTPCIARSRMRRSGC